MFQGNHIWSLWRICNIELNDHMDIENERNCSIWCWEREENLGRTWVGKNLIKEEFWGDILSWQDNVLMEDVWSVDNRGYIFWRDDVQIIDLFFNFLRLTTKMRRYFVKDMFKHSKSVILSNDTLEGFIVKGCWRTRYGIGNGLVKCSGHDDVKLTWFVMEKFYQKS